MATKTRRTSSSRGRGSRAADPATAYAEGVCAGKIIAGPHVRDACARHLRDLKEGPKRGLVWRADLADRFYRYCETVLRLNGGEHEGKPFNLELWQKFVQGSIFGWTREDGYRRFRVAYIETAKGSGKSPTAAATGTYGLTADDEARAEIYAAATKKDQAMILFRDAVAMVDQSPQLSSRITKSGGNPTWNLLHGSSRSFFRPIASDDGQSGPRPHMGLLDEFHEAKTALVRDMLKSGQKGRKQPLLYIITNSGFDRASPCFQEHEYAIKVCAGDLVDDEFFGYVCACDEDDDPLTDPPDPELGYPRSWVKTNPNIGVTIPVSYLEGQVREALGMPSKESIVRRLNFCQWVDAESPWIDGDLWRACEVAAEDWTEPPKTAPTFLALDLSQTRDLTAAAKVTETEDGPVAELRFWTPADTLQERERNDRVPYDAWVRAGHLIAVPGRAIDYSFVVEDLKDWITAATALAFDQYRMKDFIRAMDDAGLESWVAEWEEKGSRWVDEVTKRPGDGLMLMRHGQGFGGGNSTSTLWMPRSITQTAAVVLDGTLRIRKNPVLTWNSASAVLEQDAQGNQKWEKRKSTGRIDGIVALSMANGMARVLSGTTEDEGSPYDERGVIFI